MGRAGRRGTRIEPAMIFRDNPVLSRELLVNLRSPRAFVLQLALRRLPRRGRLLLLAGGGDGARQVSSGVAQRLFELFFLGQFFLVALAAPTFAAGSITGEKERKTYEMLLASPLEPMTILIGKLLSSLTLPGDPDPLEPAADDPLLPAGRHPALGDRAGLPRPDPGGRDVRPAERGLLQLLPPDELGPGGQLPGHPAAGRRLPGADADREHGARATSCRSPCSPPGAWRSGPSS